jgi:hypothetical protein
MSFSGGVVGGIILKQVKEMPASTLAAGKHQPATAG